MATAGPAVFHMVATRLEEGRLRLVDVEGDLEADAVTRWTRLFDGAISEGATGIAVDLRGCVAVAPVCLSVLRAVSEMLRARGGGGVKLVTTPDSALGRRLRTALAPDELPRYTSARGALLSLRDAR
jgi:anti-anti-sigma regulatory factor